jgi:hypothetical protein
MERVEYGGVPGSVLEIRVESSFLKVLVQKFWRGPESLGAAAIKKNDDWRFEENLTAATGPPQTTIDSIADRFLMIDQPHDRTCRSLLDSKTDH